MLVKISVCNRRTDKKYKNKELEWDYIIERNRTPIRTSETAEEYSKLPKARRGDLKDIGGLVGGWLKEGIRKNGNVTFRTLGLLDADNIPAGTDFQRIVRTALDGVTYFLYSTHSHTPENPRCRIVILLGREVSEDEYPAVMRMVAKQIGMDYFDDSTYEANRMMYWASCPSNGEFVFDEQTGEPLNPDKYLGMYADWRDVTQWPTSTRQSEAVKREVTKQEDPLMKQGVVGAFCRTYSITEAIDKFLPEVYAPSVIEGRYDYIPGEGTAGVVVYDDKFAYSHHATDPASGKLLNSFDLVRIHKFGEDDKMSMKDMLEFALSIDEVKLQIAHEKAESINEDFADDWHKKLQYMTRSTVLQNSVWNEMLILNNDPDFAGFAYNEMANRIQVTGAVPWDRPTDNKFWRDADTAQLKALIDIRYVCFSDRNHNVSFTKVADDRRFHPIRDYLDSLSKWDGTPRCDTLISRYLQAEDTPYTRAVSRKTLVAAVQRIYHPGTKFDSVTVLDGAQGIGKSSLWKELAGDEYFSDALSLTDMDDKSGAEKLQGFWIIEIGELAGMKKADIEKVKSFLSTSDDKYRPSYGKVVESHPRQCIVVATVNGEHGYLRDITGNRRFWIVKCRQQEKAKKWTIAPEERDQIWAEAKFYYKHGEKLYLEGEILEDSEKVQREAMEVDERLGLVEDYLDTLLPDTWVNMDLYQRRDYLSGDVTAAKGSIQRTEVSNAEIWCECFGRNIADLKPSDSYAIAALMTKVEGWERTNKTKRQPIYGKQRLYIRCCSSDKSL